jgi:UDP-N-acetylglucosamine acyltransferase
LIGADCDLREAVTMNIGTASDRGITVVGDRCLLMVNAHVGHDCQVGDDVTMANNVALGGHVTVENNVFIGGQSVVHQFVRIGQGAMIGGTSGVAADIIPFGFAFGQRAALVGLNVVGLRRRGIDRAALHRLRRAYRRLFLGEGLFQERLAEVERDFADDPRVAAVTAFIRAGGKRPLTMAAGRAAAGDNAGDAP